MDIFFNNESEIKYADIIDKKRPRFSRHTPMSIQNRAKIFCPFSALKGYEEALRAKEKIVVSPIELSEDMKEMLDEKLHMLEDQLSHGGHPILTAVYFHPDPESPGDSSPRKGEYLELTGMAARLDLNARILQIVDTKIPLGDLRSLQGELFETVEERTV